MLLMLAALAASVVAVVLASPPAQAATFTVTTAADEQTTNAQCSLREAIINANQNDQSGSADCAAGVGEDTINFNVSSPASITLGSQLPVITDSAGLIIDGGSANITVSGNTAVRVFEVGSGAKFTLNKLTVANGRSSPACSFCDYSGSGGGFYNAGTLTVRNSTLSGNRASATDSSSGGGIYNTDSGTLTVNNSTLSGNSSRCAGGGIYNAGTLTVSNSTLSDNFAVICGGGGGISNNSLNSTATLKNTIVANSSIGGNCAGTITNGGYNLDSGTSCGFTTENNSLSSTDPMLGVLTGNGGPTATHALLEGSPAIDKGNSFGATTDQRGVARQQGAAPDIGSFELEKPDTQAPKVNNNTSPANNATGVSRTANVTATFSEAMNEASVEATGVVTLKKSSGGAAVAATVDYNPTTKKVILNPNVSLARNTLYSAKVATGATDLAGNQLDQNSTTGGNQAKSWKFTTVQ
jgi:CSLREA domain-containing protein